MLTLLAHSPLLFSTLLALPPSMTVLADQYCHPSSGLLSNPLKILFCNFLEIIPDSHTVTIIAAAHLKVSREHFGCCRA